MSDPARQTHYRACNLCEAICGLEIQTEDGHVASIRGDADDPLSHGHLCPKGVALQDIHKDPDRLRAPLRKTATGGWEEVPWDSAFEEIAERTAEVRRRHGENSFAVYLGNPTVHNYGTLLFSRLLVNSLGRPQLYSATSVDQLPHHFASSYMFGHSMLIPIPDIDRTKFMLILGANPLASNGSIMTAPGVAERLKAIRAKGGQVVLIDPRRTETSRAADRHHFIQPGSDVWLLAALLNVIFRDSLDSDKQLQPHCNSRSLLQEVVSEITPEFAAERTGISADDTTRLAHDFATSHTAVCYGRMGLSTQLHGGLCQWLINGLNIVTGNFDRAGGAMFTTPAVSVVGRAGTLHNVGRWKTRVRERSEFDGQLPVAALAEEILTPGKGQIRGLFTVCGNPVLSTPNGRQVERALESLDLHVAVDIYLNETTRNADFILPPTASLETDHYDLAFHALAVRNTARYSPRTVTPGPSTRTDWQILSRLAWYFHKQRGGWTGLKGKLLTRIMQRLTPTGILDLGLKLGPYGAWRSPRRWRSGLTFKRLQQHPHGLDLGPLQPQLPKCLRMPSGRINLAPAVFVERFRHVHREQTDANNRSEGEASGTAGNRFRYIGRRHLRSNNSWMHNSERLTKGKSLCTVMMNSEDAERLGFQDGQMLSITSRTGEIQLPLEASEDIAVGVLSIPHGYGHHRPGTQLHIAETTPGASANDLTDELRIDELTGNAAFSGLPVTVRAVAEKETT